MPSNIPNGINRMEIRAVVDTSSLVQYNLRVKLQESAKRQEFVPIWSVWIVAELNRVLTWRWIISPPAGIEPVDLSTRNQNRCSDAAKEMMKKLIPVFEAVDPHPPYPPAWNKLTDQGDIPIWAAAKVGNAQYVVSENTHDYPPRQPNGRYMHESIEYLSGRAFLDMLDARRRGGIL